MTLKHLPIIENPGFATECYHNLRLSIIMAYPNLRPWCMSHYYNLIMYRESLDTFPRIHLEEHLNIYSNVLSEQTLLVKQHKTWKQEIIERLKNDTYVLLYLNWKFIPQSSFYRREDMIHECLIYGYNEDQQTFDTLAFEVDRKSYGTTTLPFQAVEEGINLMFNQHMHSHKWFAHYGFPLSTITIKNQPPPTLDETYIYFSLDQARHPSLLASNHYSKGFYIYHHLSTYFREQSVKLTIEETERVLWMIIIDKLIQHHTFFFDRLNFLDLQEVIQLLKATQKHFVYIRALSLRYFKNLDSGILLRIADLLEEIYQAHKRAIPLFMDHLVQSKLST